LCFSKHFYHFLLKDTKRKKNLGAGILSEKIKSKGKN